MEIQTATSTFSPKASGFYKPYRRHKEAIVTLLEKTVSSASLPHRCETLTATLPKLWSLAGSLRLTRRHWSITCGGIPDAP